MGEEEPTAGVTSEKRREGREKVCRGGGNDRGAGRGWRWEHAWSVQGTVGRLCSPAGMTGMTWLEQSQVSNRKPESQGLAQDLAFVYYFL